MSLIIYEFLRLATNVDFVQNEYRMKKMDIYVCYMISPLCVVSFNKAVVSQPFCLCRLVLCYIMLL